jgi:hypothetical protein
MVAGLRIVLPLRAPTLICPIFFSGHVVLTKPTTTARHNEPLWVCRSPARLRPAVIHRALQCNPRNTWWACSIPFLCRLCMRFGNIVHLGFPLRRIRLNAKRCDALRSCDLDYDDCIQCDLCRMCGVRNTKAGLTLERFRKAKAKWRNLLENRGVVR